MLQRTLTANRSSRRRFLQVLQVAGAGLRAVLLGGLVWFAGSAVQVGKSAAEDAPAPVGRDEIRCEGDGCSLGACVTAKFWGDPASVSQSARIVPRFVDGQPRGFKLYGLRPGTVLGQLGLENGDVVVGVNGKELTSPESALAVYMECKDAALLTLALERKDQPLVRRIRFERRPLAAGECPPLAQPTEQPAAPPSVVAAKTVSPRNRELSPPAALRNIAQDITCKATRCTLRNGVGDRILANTNLLATSARIVPTVEGGTVIGFKLFAIRAGSVLALLGLKNGDVVRTINDYELSAPDKALEAYTKLRQASELRVRVDRNGAPLVLVYVVKR